MYRLLRSIHKVAGLVGSIFLILIACTGFFLALKGRMEWVRPPTASGTASASNAGRLLNPDEAVQAARAAGIPTLQSMGDVDRLEYHAKKNVYKILAKTGYDEVQIDGTSGKVLSVGKRNDQMFEDIHDLSFFHPVLRETALPVIAVILFVLGTSGVTMYFVPIARRRRFQREQHRARGSSET
ncbi:MAG TPA: PepSY-associated TM helix domain-containing protein [Fimbriimonadaceae bacterium]|nr:PepSY-associated TM helix domain-containing protein [Fimbriimonadaceae bacterium]HRJ33567.1 PepSY-associated TM helix domain-containing protein [Fimbriimonadaceae bacterium]